ncbi:hypothetical protein MSAN_01698100 [Mycena sanguinolenta]|uniref:Uncharacterized protein n=1 Tax=Mycena sanguinolenta TaxID=230812 RepID=A0A8H6XWV3_9AGAR|nr:hypothetical protein MSAN_01698100 [Mycena sanguinolenta]
MKDCQLWTVELHEQGISGISGAPLFFPPVLFSRYVTRRRFRHRRGVFERRRIGEWSGVGVPLVSGLPPSSRHSLDPLAWDEMGLGRPVPSIPFPFLFRQEQGAGPAGELTLHRRAFL